MKHTEKIAIDILREHYADYIENSWHYDEEYTMLCKAIEKVREARKKAAQFARSLGAEHHKDS